MTFDIANKTILVTGANRGIGKTLVTSLIEQGAAKVYAAVRNLDSATALVETYGDKIVPIQINLGDVDSITAAAQIASDVQMVVNNAGAFQGTTPLAEDAIASLQLEMDINVYGLIRMAQAFAPTLKANGGGAFVQLNSVVSIKTFANFATYSASKAASYAMTQALRELLSEQGTRVLSIHPGPIATDMSSAAGLGDIAESPTIVADGIIAALKTGEFHVFPDTMAQQIGGAYQSFATNVVEVTMTEE
ncbi:SDR family oxidoreductase [Acaryochloris marina]|uniref:Oxidoreductase, short chain dehydrogenase/reductase family protein n=1 Tax=Acaryochloris marina (strain MBIC 11017) TaxID=329726 RepID=B0CEM2_ACAM1|nr:SDR family oxidoreductase [Acaryochloris marina]ABW28127.1 oxidoreductase, short chain dehydrogenase/reductase family protein [Acaryochloris marina MBIC11017]BDM77164.1 short-chain dehydrogenase [Acaryochloris marina MBIC10699]